VESGEWIKNGSQVTELADVIPFLFRPFSHYGYLCAKFEEMLQVAFIRNNKEEVKQRLAVKNFTELNLVDEIVALDDERKRLQLEFDNTQAKVNSTSKEIGQLMAKGQKEVAEEKKQEVASLKSSLQPITEQLAVAEKKLQETLVILPNLPSEKVPPGKTPADNIVVRAGGTEPVLDSTAVPHWDLIKKYDIVDFETGAKITGSGFPLYKGKGAKLQRALVQYFLDFNTAAGYTEYLPPLMVNEATAYGTGQLPDKEGQMYFMPADNFYMIPTSEVPVTNIYRDEILKEENLPVKMTAYSPCFRREAGSFGKDVRGLNRVHQFDKVEIVQLVHPEKSYEVLEEMVSHVEKLLNTLELPYRILKLCGGDMSFASALTYDFEVYSAAQQRWLEVSSVSNFENFQTNRMKIRFKDGNGKMQLVHSLNGSSLALPRIVACLLENNQTTEGIQLPLVLHEYFGAESI
jgi:seryl-tRNA synthetase